jgi:hypothetical protein
MHFRMFGLYEIAFGFHMLISQAFDQSRPQIFIPLAPQISGNG